MQTENTKSSCIKSCVYTQDEPPKCFQLPRKNYDKTLKEMKENQKCSKRVIINWQKSVNPRRINN